MNVQDYARETRGVLEKKGWCQGMFEDTQGHLCLMGAINAVIGSANGVTVNTLRDDQIEIVRELSHRLGLPPSMWNDDPSTTLEDVMLILKEIEHDGII